MSEQIDDEEAAFEADEEARIAALQRTAPDRIWLQVDPEGEACSAEWDLLDGATWCSQNINKTDVEYVKVGRIAELEAELNDVELIGRAAIAALEQQRDELVEAAAMAVEMIETNAHERRHVRWKLKDAIAKVKQ